jgi:hypothetical protein
MRVLFDDFQPEADQPLAEEITIKRLNIEDGFLSLSEKIWVSICGNQLHLYVSVCWSFDLDSLRALCASCPARGGVWLGFLDLVFSAEICVQERS